LSEDVYTSLMAAINRVHERIDALVEKESVTGKDCETRRNSCRVCMNTKIEKASGVPKWVATLGSIGSAVITGLTMYVLIGK